MPGLRRTGQGVHHRRLSAPIQSRNRRPPVLDGSCLRACSGSRFGGLPSTLLSGCRFSFQAKQMSHSPSAHLTLRFHGDLRNLLKGVERGAGAIDYPLNRKASLKDIIESLGVPHTEIGCIKDAAKELSFACIPVGGMLLDIYAASADFPPTVATVLRPEPLEALRFMVDSNVSRLTGLLRMAGFDALPVPTGSKRSVAEAAAVSGRILLTRDKELLQHRCVVYGRLLRSQKPHEQLAEVSNHYQLAPLKSPFSRCMRCNGLLESIDKESILGRLEPLTKKYYSAFKQCPLCEQIYWSGSHHQNMIKILESIF